MPVLALNQPRAAPWLALAIVLLAMVLPDCCLAGRHAFGFGMELYGPICRARG